MPAVGDFIRRYSGFEGTLSSQMEIFIYILVFV